MPDEIISEDDIANADKAPPSPAPAPAAEPSPRSQPQEQAEPHPSSSEAPPAPSGEPRMVPIGEVQAQRERRKKAEAETAQRDRELAEMRGRFAALEQQTRQSQPQPPQQPPAPTEWDWENPQAFTRRQAETVADERMRPVTDMQRRMIEVQTYNNRMLAEQVFTSDAVKAAEEAFNTAAARHQIDPLEHARINNSPNPFAEAVKWHKRSLVMTAVGEDPEKFFQAQLDQRLKSDPEFQKQVFERLNGQAQTASGTTGRDQPVFTGLPSVNAAAGASARGETSISDEDIYKSAPQKMGRR